MRLSATQERAAKWLRSNDTGTSSRTIAYMLSGLPVLDPWPRTLGDTPSDPSDFGRCYRLLACFPRWRRQLTKVAVTYPRWAPLIAAWDELTALYERDVATGLSMELWNRLSILNGHGPLSESVMNPQPRTRHGSRKTKSRPRAERAPT